MLRKLQAFSYEKSKKAALELVTNRLGYFNKAYNFKYNHISIKRHRSRWGSCSQKGNLNFNYKIVFLPPDVSDYIIVHELCHLQEFNHSRSFWELVAKTIPNHKEIRTKLKNYNGRAQ